MGTFSGVPRTQGYKLSSRQIQASIVRNKMTRLILISSTKTNYLDLVIDII